MRSASTLLSASSSEDKDTNLGLVSSFEVVHLIYLLGYAASHVTLETHAAHTLASSLDLLTMPMCSIFPNLSDDVSQRSTYHDEASFRTSAFRTF